MPNAASEPTERSAEVFSLRHDDLSTKDTISAVRELVDVNKIGPAREVLAHAMSDGGERKELLLLLAEIEKDDGNHEQAMSWFQRSLELYPADPAVVSGYAYFLYDAGMRRRVLDLIANSPSDTARDPGVCATLASIYLSAGWYASAYEAYGNRRNISRDHRGARRHCWLLSGGPLALIRKLMLRSEGAARRRWEAWSANVSQVDNLGQDMGFASAKLRGDLDEYIRVSSKIWKQWEVIWIWRRRWLLLITGITWIVVFLAQEIIWIRTRTAVAILLATVATICAFGLSRAAVWFGNASRSWTGLAIRGALVGAVTVGGGFALVTLAAAPPAWPGILGMILLATATIGFVSALVLNLARLILFSRLRALDRSHPREAILDILIDMLVEVSHPDMRNDFGQRAIWVTQLERAASRMEGYLAQAVLGGDPHTDEWAGVRARGAAAALRRMKRRIIAPSGESWTRLIAELRQEISAVASGNLASLRWTSPPPPEAVRQRTMRVALSAVRVVIVTGLPFAAVIMLQIFLGVGGHYIAGAWIGAVSWAVIYLLTTIDPTVPSRVELARGIFSGFAEPKQANLPLE